MGNWSYNPTYRSYNPIYNWKGAHLVSIVNNFWWHLHVEVLEVITLGFQRPRVRMYLEPQNIPKTPNLRRYLED